MRNTLNNPTALLQCSNTPILQSPNPRRRAAGFTIVELLVVMALILFLAGLITGVAVLAQRKAAVTKAAKDMEILKNGLEEYRLEYGRYPLTLDPATLSWLADWNSDVEFTDPWGNAFVYSNESRFVYHLWSYGTDGSNSVDDIDSRQAY